MVREGRKEMEGQEEAAGKERRERKRIERRLGNGRRK